MRVCEGALPTDLVGHMFVVGMAGTVESGGLPYPGATSLMSGDGMICRYDFDGRTVRVKTRLARTPDFVADALTRREKALAAYRFAYAGITRVGLLGTRNFANTAFTPVRFGGGPERLLLGYDAGRPVEVDPTSLRVLGPVGAQSTWRAEIFEDLAFPTVLTPAHPAFDPQTDELFTLNYGRGLGSFAMTVPLLGMLGGLPGFGESLLERSATVLGASNQLRRLLKRLARTSTRIDQRIEAFLDDTFPTVPDTFTDLMRWRGDSSQLERWRLVLPNEREVRIDQSVHQVAVTRRYVVVLETGFKLGLQSGFNDPIPRTDVVDRLARALLTRPQRPSTVLCIVPRRELDRKDLPVGNDGVPRVTCQRVEVPIESLHLLTDYDDEDDRVGVMLAHAPATDLSEWIRPYDVHHYTGHRVDPDLCGMIAVGAMDVGRIGRYVIDAARGRVLSTHGVSDDRFTWAVGLYGGPTLGTSSPLPARHRQVFWLSGGAFSELLTDFVYDLYEHYPHRLVPLSQIEAMADQGRPSSLFRVDVDAMRLADAYAFPDGHIAASMQFVPRGDDGAAEASDGHLICNIYTPRRPEVWVFDSARLHAGPSCRLYAPDFVQGFTLHTAWLKELSAVKPSLVTARQDLEPKIRDPKLKAAFERHVYPLFETPGALRNAQSRG